MTNRFGLLAAAAIAALGSSARGGDLPSGAVARIGPPPPAGQSAWSIDVLAFSPDGRRLGWIDGGAVRVCNVAANTELWRVVVPPRASWQGFAFAPDGRTIAVGFSNSAAGGVLLFDTDSGKEVKRLLAETPDIGSLGVVAFAPDGKTVAAACRGPDIRFWDVATGKLLDPLRLNHPVGDRVVYSPDGRFIAASDWTSTHVWAAAGRRSLHLLPVSDGTQAWHLGFSSDGRFLATGSFGGAVDLWSMRTGKRVGGRPAGWPRRWVVGLAFSPIGFGFVTTETAAGEAVIRIWEVATGRERFHREGVPAAGPVAVAPDGRTFAVGGPGPAAHLWDVAVLGRGDGRLSDEQVWAALGGTDPEAAFRAACQLAAAGRTAAVLRRRLGTATFGYDAGRVKQWVADLGGRVFDGWAAEKELRAVRHLVVRDVVAALDGSPSPAARERLRDLAAGADDPVTRADHLRLGRGVEALLLDGSPDALTLLKELRDRFPAAWFTPSIDRILARPGRK